MTYFRFVLACLAVGLGSYAMQYLLDLFRVPQAVSAPIESVYTVLLVVFAVALVVLTVRILAEGRRHTAR